MSQAQTLAVYVFDRSRAEALAEAVQDLARLTGARPGVLTDNRTGEQGQEYQPSRPIGEYRSALSAEYLWLQRNANYKSLMSARELNWLLKRKLADAVRRGDKRYKQNAEYREAISEKHFRFTDPIINMVMLLLGLPLLVSRERRSTKTAIFLTLLGSGGCFVTTFVCKLLAGGTLDPLLAAWMPIVVFLPLSVLAFDGLKT